MPALDADDNIDMIQEVMKPHRFNAFRTIVLYTENGKKIRDSSARLAWAVEVLQVSGEAQLLVFRQAEAAQDALLNPDVIHIPNPYKPIGGGGYRDLFRGINAQKGLRIMLKRPRISEQKEAKAIKRRLIREGRIWSTLQYHVNIVPFLGIVEIADETSLVLPWLEHGDLSRFVPERLCFLELPDGQRRSHVNRLAFERFDEWDILKHSLHDHAAFA
ncbi:hypothetical protein FRB96_004414 [Tulasnella sp. 330]|nr:hypothetical protein FRB96_004414 [Tulasnella sp. 330]KAG8884517.1 hypothetical protein FRB97_004030 [Tulasnella sp. 331]